MMLFLRDTIVILRARININISYNIENRLIIPPPDREKRIVHEKEITTTMRKKTALKRIVRNSTCQDLDLSISVKCNNCKELDNSIHFRKKRIHKK